MRVVAGCLLHVALCRPESALACAVLSVNLRLAGVASGPVIYLALDNDDHGSRYSVLGQ